MLFAATCAPPHPRPLFPRAPGRQWAGFNPGLHGHVLKPIIVGHQRALQPEAQGQHLKVNRRKTGQISGRSGRGFRRLEVTWTGVHPFDLSGFHQHPSGWRKAFQFIELTRAAHASCEPFERPMQQGRGVQHRALCSAAHGQRWKPSSKKHPPAKT